MDTTALYDRVNRTASLSKPEFVAFYNDSVIYLVSRYREKYVCDGKHTKLARPDDGSNVYEYYSDAILNNIIYLKTNNADRKTDFIQEADSAYKTIWNESISKKQIKLRRFI